jgi:hypothetical protein
MTRYHLLAFNVLTEYFRVFPKLWESIWKFVTPCQATWLNTDLQTLPTAMTMWTLSFSVFTIMPTLPIWQARTMMKMDPQAGHYSSPLSTPPFVLL